MQQNTCYFSATLKGTKHRENKDNFLVIDDPLFFLFVVFDGVSSAKESKQAVDQAKMYIKENYKFYLNQTVNIRTLMFDLNTDLINSNLAEPYSTYCLLYLEKASQQLYYSWLGDSRIYTITNQFVEKLTEDDSISENVLTKFLGSPELSIEDFRQKKCDKKEGHLLLCTDGFHTLFESNKLKFFNTFNGKSLSKVKERIVSLVEGNNVDDSTFIFIK